MRVMVWCSVPVLCAVMLALVVALNLFVGALPAKYLRYDMTENKLYSLSQETEDLCAVLTQDVTFYYLGRTGQEDVGFSWGSQDAAGAVARPSVS